VLLQAHFQLGEPVDEAFHVLDLRLTRLGSLREFFASSMKQHVPLTLTRQDWRGPRAGWGENGLGYWDVDFAGAASYDVTVRMPAQGRASTARLRIGKLDESQPLPAGVDRVVFRAIKVPKGVSRVEATFDRSGQEVGVHYVDLDCREPPDK
jgi:hypothetical protein